LVELECDFFALAPAVSVAATLSAIKQIITAVTVTIEVPRSMICVS